MKILPIFAICFAAACATAHAATPAAKPASKTTRTATTADSQALVGFWKSVNAEGLLLPGTIDLRADNHAVLSPKGEERLEGTWATKGSELTLTMPPYGKAQMQYEVSAKGMTLTYENGTKQKFIKELSKKFIKELSKK